MLPLSLCVNHSSRLRFCQISLAVVFTTVPLSSPPPNSQYSASITNLRVTTTGFDQLDLCWAVPLSTQLRVARYTLLYATTILPPFQWSKSKDNIDAMAVCHSLVGLKPSTRYFVQLMVDLTDTERRAMAQTIVNGTTSGDAGLWS